MLTRMTDDDWALVLKTFRAARSQRGNKGRDDRRFPEALYYFAVHSISCCALPAELGDWNTVWNRFWRLSQSGTFEAFFQALAACSQTAGLIQMFDSTSIRAHVSAAGAKGGQDNQALGRSRGGFGTRIHVKCDKQSLPLDFQLTENQASDSRQFEILLDIGPDITPRAIVTDKGYDARANRQAVRDRGMVPVIPYRSNVKGQPRSFPKAIYKVDWSPKVGQVAKSAWDLTTVWLAAE